MRACGLIVEYNPFHNGHKYHIEEARKISNADCIIVVMSGNFLQRGEPAIIDKFSRTRAALADGADIVLELPYVYAVQNSDHFAYGAVQILNAIGVSSICFGSESGKIAHFINSHNVFTANETTFQEIIKSKLADGFSFPESSMYAYQEIGLTNENFDLAQPNNILGYSYVKNILDYQFNIEPLTIKRFNNHYHTPELTNHIASATSIRKEIFKQGDKLNIEVRNALPSSTIEQLELYKQLSGVWHNWEQYFKLIHYRVQTMTSEELQKIHGVDEGLEHRVKRTAKTAVNMTEWIAEIKTKRYTWTRIQRMFVHILTNTKKNDLKPFLETKKGITYLRLLGMTKDGQKYLNKTKKDLNVPILTAMSRNMHPMLELEEKATNAYYSILSPSAREKLVKQEMSGPIIYD